MNITIVGTAYPLRGGIAHYNALLAEALKARHTVNTITFKRQYPAILFPGKTQQESGESMKAEPAPELIDSINPFNWVKIGRMIRDQRPDLVIFKYWLPFFGPCFGTIARIVRRNHHTRVLFICDNVLPHERRPGDLMFTRYAFRAVDYFIVQSAAVEKDLLEVHPSATYRYAPHPVYNIFGSPLPQAEARNALGITEPNVVLFFGYIRRYKGLHVLLESLRHVPEALSLRVLVVGEFYDGEGAYRSRVRDLHLEDRVTIVSEYAPNERVRLYFSAADVVVLPYLSATQSGIAQIAYHFDTPVIATNVGGLAEVVRDGSTGLIVPPEDPEALANAIRRYFETGLGSKFRPTVRQEKTRYSWENMVLAIESMVTPP